MTTRETKGDIAIMREADKKAPKDRGVPKFLQEVIDSGGTYKENPKTGEITIIYDQTEPIFRLKNPDSENQPREKKKLTKKDYVNKVVKESL